MERRPIEARIATGRDPEPPGPGVSSEAFREAMSRWASGVTVVAVRDQEDGRIYATTVTSFASVSAEPPRIVISFGPGAQVLPFLDEGSRFAVNVLGADQEGLARVFADPFPVGRSPFPDEGDPLLDRAHATLTCTTERIVPVGACRLAVGLVESVGEGQGAAPLLYHRRAYRSLE